MTGPAGLTAEALDALVGGMTLREKVGQLNQRLYGWDAVRRTADGYELTDAFHAEVERWSGMGALYGLFRADAWSGRDWTTGIPPEDRAAVAALVDDAVRAASPHGIGALLVEEAPHGHQALGGPLLPVNLNVGATWDPDLYREATAAVAHALSRDGVHLALVSALDLLRDPRWGRSEECYAEDPLLSARLAAAAVEGMQGVGRSRIADGTGVGVVLKHFAAQGEGVGGRNGHSAHLGARDLEELHLPAARAGVEAGAYGLMAAYNDIDGLPCIANRGLLTELLRGTWGFDGIVMADGKAIDRMVGPLGSPEAAASAALTAGVDLSLWDESYARLEDAVGREPSLHAALDEAVRRVLRVKADLGLLAPPAARDDDPGEDPRRAAVALSARIARQSLVLLSNDGVLPAPARGRWVVTGRNADSVTALLGDYVPPLAGGEPSIAAALAARGAAEGFEVRHVPGLPTADDLAGADLVVAVVGGTSHRRADDEFSDNGAIGGDTDADCGEGVDRSDLSLPHGQDAFLQALRANTTAPIVAVVVAGRPYVLGPTLAAADAVLFAGYPGPHGADEVAAVLRGDHQPTGRLSATIPPAPGAVPARYNERIDPVYHDLPGEHGPAFGAGIGYAQAAIVSSSAVVVDDGVRIEAEVEGRALADGWAGPAVDVVQVFVCRRGALTWPRRAELAAFARVEVPIGERRTVRLVIPTSAAFVDPADVPALAAVTTRVEIRTSAGTTTHQIGGSHA
ncbi:MAG: glycoside hydrolase family 3 N-terminal domain-containing protein [Arachnia sp.]